MRQKKFDRNEKLKNKLKAKKEEEKNLSIINLMVN
jgi:hypothetical protein